MRDREESRGTRNLETRRQRRSSLLAKSQKATRLKVEGIIGSHFYVHEWATVLLACLKLFWCQQVDGSPATKIWLFKSAQHMYSCFSCNQSKYLHLQMSLNFERWKNFWWNYWHQVQSSSSCSRLFSNGRSWLNSGFLLRSWRRFLFRPYFQLLAETISCVTRRMQWLSSSM